MCHTGSLGGMSEIRIQAVIGDIDDYRLTTQSGVQTRTHAILVLTFVEMHSQLTGEDRRLGLFAVNQGDRYLIDLGDGVASQRSNLSECLV